MFLLLLLACGEPAPGVESPAPEPVVESPAPLSPKAQAIHDIQQTLRARLPELNTCYEARRWDVPDFEGRWRLMMTVRMDGSVRHVKAVGVDREDAVFEACLVEAIEGWWFPEIDENQPIKHTVDFRP